MGVCGKFCGKTQKRSVIASRRAKLAFFLSMLRFVIHIHRCGNIRMTHDLLNQLQIAFTFAQACAECVTQLMYAEARKNERIPILNQSYPPFTLIVIINDSGNGTIHTMRTENVSKTILPNESAVAIYDTPDKIHFPAAANTDFEVRGEHSGTLGSPGRLCGFLVW